LVKINEVSIHNLEAEIQNYRDSSLKQERLISKLEKERQKYGAEASQAGVKYMQVCPRSSFSCVFIFQISVV
jgi:hypothetical protein